jgi:hypothetical protein
MQCERFRSPIPKLLAGEGDVTLSAHATDPKALGVPMPASNDLSLRRLGGAPGSPLRDCAKWPSSALPQRGLVPLCR